MVGYKQAVCKRLQVIIIPFLRINLQAEDNRESEGSTANFVDKTKTSIHTHSILKSIQIFSSFFPIWNAVRPNVFLCDYVQFLLEQNHSYSWAFLFTSRHLTAGQGAKLINDIICGLALCMAPSFVLYTPNNCSVMLRDASKLSQQNFLKDDLSWW